MAQKIVKTRLVHRRDLSTKWSSVNPILLDGEMGIEKDTRKFKIGNGTTAWNDLPYANVTNDDLLARFSVSNDENTPGTAPVRDDNNQININTLDSGGDTVAVNKGYMKKHVETEINKISQGGKVATLDESGKIPASQLPSYVDDVLEGKFLSSNAVETSPFITSLPTHIPITTGPLDKLYFNFEKYKDKGIAAIEKIFPEMKISRYNLLKFESGYFLSLILENISGWIYRLSIVEEQSSTSFINLMDIYRTSSSLKTPVPVEPIEIPDEYGQVIEVYSENEYILHSVNFMDFISPEPFPENDGTKDAGKIYLDLRTNKTYRWSGTQYVEISPTLALGETSSTAYAGNKGKQNADNITALQAKVESLQSKEDSTLQTTNKTVPGAINELKQKQDTNSTNIQTNTTNITELQQDLTAANTSIASNFNRITDLEGVADEVLIEIEEINEILAQGGGSGGSDILDADSVNGNYLPDKIYKKTKSVGGWKGVTIPNTGTVEKVYINTKLTVDEVTNILNSVNLDNYTVLEDDYHNSLYFGKYEATHNETIYHCLYISKNGSSIWKNTDLYEYNTLKGYDTFLGWKDVNDNTASFSGSLQNIDGQGNQNDKLTILFSLEPFEYIEPDVDFYQYKDGSLKKILNENDSVDAVTVSELPTEDIDENKLYKILTTEPGQLIGGTLLDFETKMNDDGSVSRIEYTIDKNTNIYLNTKLTVEEVVSLFDSYSFNGSYDPWQILAHQTSSGNQYFHGFGVCKNTEDSGTDYVIYYEPSPDGGYVTDMKILFTSNGSGKYSFTGWSPDITYPLILEPTKYGSPFSGYNGYNDDSSDIVEIVNTLFYSDPLQYSDDKVINVDYYRYKNNRWFKLLDEPDIMDVDKLPEGEWQGTVVVELDKLYRIPIKTSGEQVGTVVPNTGFVDKVYVNTNLSDEEVEAIIDNLCSVNGEQNQILYNLFQRDDDEICCAIYIMVEGPFKAVSAFFDRSDGNGDWITDFSGFLWCNNMVADAEGLTAGWQDFTNPIEFNTEVQDIYDSGIYNDQLTSLFSTTPYGPSEPTGYDYYQFKNGAPKKILNEDDAVLVEDVEELPSATIDTSTAVPSSGMAEKVYFNTKLSVEELYNIFETLTYGDVPGTNYYPLAPVIANSDMSSALVAMKVTGGLEYDYLLNIMINGGNTRILNLSREKAEWFMSETLIRYESVAEFLAPQIGLEVQNDKLKQLISITPFEAPNPDIELDKLYRTPIKTGGGWIGTVVPNTGTVEKVYFNTELSVEEVTKLVSELPFIKFGADEIYILAQDSDKTYIVGRVSTTYQFVIMETLTNTIYWTNTIISDLNITKIGWQDFTNPIEINGEIDDANNAGAENNKLTSLFSTTPFTQTETELKGYKYHQFVNGEWKELINELPKDLPVIIESSTTSNTYEDLVITSEMFKQLWESNNAILKVAILTESNANGNITQFNTFIKTSTQMQGGIRVIVLLSNFSTNYTVLNIFDYSGIYGAEAKTPAIVNDVNLEFKVSEGILTLSATINNASGYEKGGVGVDTTTLTDSDNLATSKAVRNYIAEYMEANYDNGDTEEF